MNYIWFGSDPDTGIDTSGTAYRSDYEAGVYISTEPAYEMPEKDIEEIIIPGRSGTVYDDTGRYKNVERTYEISVYNKDYTAVQMSRKLSKWLHKNNGYRRLYDSYEPLVYRLAMCKSGINVENLLNIAGKASLVFECKPQRYLLTGDGYNYWQTGSFTLTNMGDYPSYPMIQVQVPDLADPSGQTYNVSVVFANGGTTQTMSFEPSVVDNKTLTIDCEECVVYDSAGNILENAMTGSSSYPVLGTGNTTITKSAYVTKVRVKPRWWTL